MFTEKRWLNYAAFTGFIRMLLDSFIPYYSVSLSLLLLLLVMVVL